MDGADVYYYYYYYLGGCGLGTRLVKSWLPQTLSSIESVGPAGEMALASPPPPPPLSFLPSYLTPTLTGSHSRRRARSIVMHSLYLPHPRSPPPHKALLPTIRLKDARRMNRPRKRHPLLPLGKRIKREYHRRLYQSSAR